MADTLVIATMNQYKAAEIADRLDLRGWHIHCGREVNDPPAVIEDGATFTANAVKKARAFASHCHSWALADDSGLVVDALNGDPGVYSARFAGRDGDDRANNRKLLELLRDCPNRRARFRCVLALCSPGGRAETVSGSCEGHITETPRGRAGFGYDPLFVPLGESRTFAEMTPAEKHDLSHRGRALRAAKRTWGAMLAEHRDDWPREYAGHDDPDFPGCRGPA